MAGSGEITQRWLTEYYGKKLSRLLGNYLPSKAFRQMQCCVDLDEKCDLLEVTMGVSLFDLSNEPKHIVLVSSQTMSEIIEREKMLKSRPNQCVLKPIDFDCSAVLRAMHTAFIYGPKNPHKFCDILFFNVRECKGFFCISDCLSAKHILG